MASALHAEPDRRQLDVFVSEMPHYEREVALVPVQSSQRHTRIRCVDTAAGLAMPGVVAWIAAADVPCPAPTCGAATGWRTRSSSPSRLCST